MVNKLILMVCLCFTVNSTFAQTYDINKHTLKLGYAKLNFSVASGELSGEFTAPGLTADAPNTGTLAFTYDYHLTPRWSLQLAGGVPPEVDLQGLNEGAFLGVLGAAKAAFPAVIGLYHVNFGDNDFYLGAGVNYTVFYEAQASDFYTQIVEGETTSVDVADSFGGVLKIGYAYQLTPALKLDFSFAKYWVTADVSLTTQTPEIGAIERKVSVDLDPNALFVMLSYDF